MSSPEWWGSQYHQAKCHVPLMWLSAKKVILYWNPFLRHAWGFATQGFLQGHPSTSAFFFGLTAALGQWPAIADDK